MIARCFKISVSFSIGSAGWSELWGPNGQNRSMQLILSSEKYSVTWVTTSHICPPYTTLVVLWQRAHCLHSPSLPPPSAKAIMHELLSWIRVCKISCQCTQELFARCPWIEKLQQCHLHGVCPMHCSTDAKYSCKIITQILFLRLNIAAESKILCFIINKTHCLMLMQANLLFHTY